MSKSFLTKLDTWEVLLSEAKDGHKSSAEQLLKKISTALNTDPSLIPNDVNQWLALAIRNILNEPKGARKHLGLTGKKNTPRNQMNLFMSLFATVPLGHTSYPATSTGIVQVYFFQLPQSLVLVHLRLKQFTGITKRVMT
jgi:hypothetical protein